MLFNSYFRVTLVFSLLILIVAFSAANDGYCTTVVAIAIGKDEAHNCLEFWLERYQSLIGAFATIAAAGIAFVAVKGQINQIERHAKDRNERDADAARAVLPLALSALCDYAFNSMKSLEATSTPDKSSFPWPSFSAPIFPASIIPFLQEAVKHSDRQRAKQITELLAASQIQTARMRDLIDTLETAVTAEYRNVAIQNGLFDAASLYARAALLFDFARGDYGRHDVPVQNIRKALVVSMIMEEEYPFLAKRLAALGLAETSASQS